jgi:hypothetical protein
MNEAEWVAANAPEAMLLVKEIVHSSDRKLRLFACGCCQRIRHLLGSVW